MFNKALIIGILLVGATFSISANEVQKWEYYVFDHHKLSIFEGFANNFGDEGWELITMIHDPSAKFPYIGFFKRKKS